MDQPRPYWHVDAKWITGILLTFILNLTLVVLAGYLLTERERAITFTTNAIESFFVRPGEEGSDNSIADLKARMDREKVDVIYPIDGLKISVTRQDVNTLTITDLRQKIFRQITEPLYDQGTSGFAASLTDDQTQRDKFANDAFLLSFFTAQTHQMLLLPLAALALTSLALFAGLIRFSFGLGRLISPAVVLIIATLPGTAIFTLGKIIVTNQQQLQLAIVTIPSRAVEPVVTSLWYSYLGALGLGFILLVSAGFRKAFRKGK
jgi:hypothetical protein